MIKIYAFDYMLSLFESWFNQVETGRRFDNLSKLHVLKLLFLVSTIKKTDNSDLLDIFNNFYALPYGPVESDIYNAILENKLPTYKVTDMGIQRKSIDTLPYNICSFVPVKESVDTLRVLDNCFVSKRTIALVEITHKWSCWRSAYDFAQFMGKNSYKMSVESIRNDKNRCYSL